MGGDGLPTQREVVERLLRLKESLADLEGHQQLPDSQGELVPRVEQDAQDGQYFRQDATTNTSANSNITGVGFLNPRLLEKRTAETKKRKVVDEESEEQVDAPRPSKRRWVSTTSATAKGFPIGRAFPEPQRGQYSRLHPDAAKRVQQHRLFQQHSQTISQAPAMPQGDPESSSSSESSESEVAKLHDDAESSSESSGANSEDWDADQTLVAGTLDRADDARYWRPTTAGDVHALQEALQETREHYLREVGARPPMTNQRASYMEQYEELQHEIDSCFRTMVQRAAPQLYIMPGW